MNKGILEEKNIMFIGGFIAGVAAAAFIGKGYQVLSKSKKKKNEVCIDHVVIRTRDAEHLGKSLEFWKDNFGFESEREKEGKAFVRDPSSQNPAFPSIRINDSSVLDLFPIEMKKFFCKNSQATDNVDHLCLNLPGAKILEILDNFCRNDVPITKVSGSFDDNGDFFGPWGAKGRGISIYLHEPNGLYLELRTYEIEYVSQIREKALPLVIHDD